VFVNPSRGICFQDLHGSSNAERRSKIHQGVNVIFHPADLNRVHAVVCSDSRHVGPQFRLELFFDSSDTFFRAEHDMDVIADV
jgi:hypothetical protein